MLDLEYDPVIISITQNGEASSKANTHSLLVAGFYSNQDEGRGFYVYDPIAPAIDKARKPNSNQKRMRRPGYYKTTDKEVLLSLDLERDFTRRWLCVKSQSSSQ